MKDSNTLNTQEDTQGFIRLSTDDAINNLAHLLRRVMFAGERIVLQQAEEEVAALIPIAEFERLDAVMYELKPSLYSCDYNDYYEDERGIHCIDPDEFKNNFDDILADVRLEGEIFGLLPTPSIGGKDVDIFMPVAVLMPIANFWVPDYLIAAYKKRD
ncbi:MAG TPA: hypothetical protein DDZ80_05055 [Cyanobacteria bacterium UBA8803]|nr:hypothetical protein [Cyanobacteria bacterium UBA9273]HBL57915.1 hypothetical protein [Cyanobacteria bacterium UBA8803]